MAERATIARPYAKAAFEHAQEQKALARWSILFAKASAVVSDPRVGKLLTNPRVSSQDLLGLIDDVCGADLDEHARSFFKELADNRRLDVLPEVTSQFETLRAEVESIVDVEITSAIALDEAQRTRLQKALEKKLQRTVRMHCAIDQTLIGGAVIRAGDVVIDGSVKARLERLAAQMTH